MPNWVTNTLHIYADQAVLDKIKEEVSSDHGVLDFDKVVPMPPSSDTFYGVDRGGISTEVMEQYGENNWYDWSREHWGTKWNCDDPRIDPDIEEDRLTYLFDTAWSAPIPIAQALADKYHVNVELLYMDEAYGYNCGMVEFNGDGELIYQEHYPKGGEEFIERHFG